MFISKKVKEEVLSTANIWFALTYMCHCYLLCLLSDEAR